MNRAIKAGIGTIVGLGLMAGTLGATLAADPTPTPVAPKPGVGWQRPCGGVAGGGGFGFQTISGPVSELLNLTPEQIYQERQGGKSLAEIAKQQGVAEDALIQTILSVRKASLDQRVKDGYLTQDQADRLYQTMQEQVKKHVEDPALGPKGARLGPGRADGKQPGGGFGFGRGMGLRFGR